MVLAKKSHTYLRVWQIMYKRQELNKNILDCKIILDFEIGMQDRGS